MPATAETVRVEGLRELQRAFKRADVKLSRDFHAKLKEVAEPVREDAQRLAGSRIGNILSPTALIDWSEMRIGVTATSVYIAPVQRGTRVRSKKRPNLAGLMLGRAMEPALAQNEREIVDGLDHLLGQIADTWGAV